MAIHGYSHDYAAIYKSDEAFMQNIYRLRDRLRSDFGYEAAIIRFPGGSSNTVSRQYSVGIMSRLAQRPRRRASPILTGMCPAAMPPVPPPPPARSITTSPPPCAMAAATWC